jgi:hypothetical protein
MGRLWKGYAHGICTHIQEGAASLSVAQNTHHQHSQRACECVPGGTVVLPNRLQAWEQLNLQPSWVPGPEDELGIARISLNHRTGDGSVHLKTIHRVFSGVPAADMKPLEGIPRFSFESVRLSMDILDSKEQVRTSGAKHPKTSTKRGDISASQNGSLGGKATEGQLSGYSSLATGTRTVCPERGVARHTVDGQDADRKRKRALSTDDISMSPALALSSDLYGCNAVPNLAGFGKLIDGALRLAICGFIKAANGIKVKASSIHSGLAELIPELWSPGFSSVGLVFAATAEQTNRPLVYVDQGTVIACYQSLPYPFRRCKGYISVTQG